MLSGSRIVSPATRPGPVETQLLVGGAVAHAALALDDDVLCYVKRPAGFTSTPLPNSGGLPLAAWPRTKESAYLAEGDRARALFARALDEFRVLRAATLVGLASEAIEIGARYAVARRAFGQPIGMYQAVAHPFADAVSARDGARLLMWKACWAMEEERPEGPELAAMAFVFAAETAYRSAAHSLHVHGGYGFMEEFDIQLYYRRAKAWAVTFADPHSELLTVADRRFGPAPSGDE
jgi:hypothetical protein